MDLRRRQLALRALATWPLLCAAVRPAMAARPDVLTVAAFPAVDQIVRAALPRWKQLHPQVEIEVLSRQFVDHHTAMTTALSTSGRLPDVMALEIGYVGRFAQGSGLKDLSAEPFGAERWKDRWVPYAVGQGRNASGAMVAVPTDIGPGTLLYRQDLFERAGVSEADLTHSWDTFVEAGRRLKARTGAYLVGHARELKDIVIRTGLPSGHGLYFDEQGRAAVHAPRFARAFELARRVRQERLDARVSNWSNEWTTGLRRGALATQVTGAWLAGHLANWLAPDTRGLWRAASLPEQAAAAYGGAFFALPRRADPARQAWAWELVRLLTLDRDLQLGAFRAHDAFPALLATHDDPFFDEPLAFLGGQRARVLWREAARRITPVAVHRHDAFADEVVNTELDKVLDRGKAIDTALADAQRLLDKRARR